MPREAFRLNMSNPAQNRLPEAVMVERPKTLLAIYSAAYFLADRSSSQSVSAKWRKSEGEPMEPVLPPFRQPFRRRLAFFADLFTRMLAILKPRDRDFASQRMCPFCGLITSRSKRFCLECGKPLKGIQVGRKDLRQE